MSRDIDLLAPAFRDRCVQVLQDCEAKKGVVMRPYFTVRTPLEQAKLWRQSRLGTQIREAANDLESNGAPYLAKCLIDAGPQYGRWATNALPGLSWHQWGLAMDCFWLVDGGAEWTKRKGYRVYHKIAQGAGLHVPLPKRDAPHVQAPKVGVLSQHSWLDIDTAMKKKFG